MFAAIAPADTDMSRIRVKICGLTNESDARAAIDAGADAVGVNFWPGSKRFVEPDAVAPWVARLPASVTRVVVGVDPTWEQALRWLALPGVDALQLHGDESPEFCSALESHGHRVIKAIRLKSADSLTEAERMSAATPLLLDSFSPDQPGGTGRTADWALAAEFVHAHPDRRVILAGGLTAENVTAAIERVQPFAVDVAGGVEYSESPRRKDLSRLTSFMRAVSGVKPEWGPAPGGAFRGLY